MAKFNVPQRLPLVKDVAALSAYLDQQADDLCRDIGENVHNYYPQLAQVSLTQLILFNRKRSGEVQRLKFSSFRKAVEASVAADSEVLGSLSEFEKVLVKSHLRMESRGKRGRKIAPNACSRTSTTWSNTGKLLALKMTRITSLQDLEATGHIEGQMFWQNLLQFVGQRIPNY